MSWLTEELGSLTNLISSGSTPLGGARIYLENGPVAFIRSQNVRMGCLDLNDVVYISNEIDSSMTRTRVAANDVLLNITGASIGRVSLFGCVGMRANVNQHVCIIRPKPDRLDARYLAHYMATPAFQSKINTVQNGGTRQALTFSQIAEFRVSLPALSEQTRIAAILDKASVIRRKREHAIQLTDEFLRSLFLDMFGDPVRNPKGWPKSSFGEQLSFMQYGPRFYNEPYTENGMRTVRITDLDAFGRLSFERMPRIDASEQAVESFSLKAGEMIFARSGATVGKTALIEEGDPPCIAGAYFLRMRFSKKVLPRYARMAITAKSMQKIIAERSRQSAQQNFSGPAVRRLPLPLPPLSLQREFAQAENRMRSQIKLLSMQLPEVELLNSVLTSRAFRGEL